MDVDSDEESCRQRQCFVFSATLLYIHLAPDRLNKRKKKKKKSKRKADTVESKIGGSVLQLLTLIDMTSLPPHQTKNSRPLSKIILFLGSIIGEIAVSKGLLSSRGHIISEIIADVSVNRHGDHTLLCFHIIDQYRHLLIVFNLILSCPPPLCQLIATQLCWAFGNELRIR